MHTKADSLSPAGKIVKLKLNQLIIFTQKLVITKVKKICIDALVNEFVKHRDMNPRFKNSLAACLLQVTVKQLVGKEKSPTTHQLMDFYLLMYSYRRKTSEIVSSNFLGPSLHYIFQQVKKKVGVTTKQNFVIGETQTIKLLI